jgi:hypothetical protein
MVVPSRSIRRRSIGLGYVFLLTAFLVLRMMVLTRVRLSLLIWRVPGVLLHPRAFRRLQQYRCCRHLRHGMSYAGSIPVLCSPALGYYVSELDRHLLCTEDMAASAAVGNGGRPARHVSCPWSQLLLQQDYRTYRLTRRHLCPWR